MRRDHRQPAGPRPYDTYRRSDEAADITQQFWGATRGWDGDPDASRAAGDGRHVEFADDTAGHARDADHDESMWADRTGPIRIIRDSFAPVTPRRAEPLRRNARGGIDRTRSHGIVRPTDPRPVDLDDDDDAPLPAPVRRRTPSATEATLGELAAGRRAAAAAAAAELDWPDDDWTMPTSRTDQVRRAPAPTRRHTSFELDDAEYDAAPLASVHPLVARLGLGAVDPLLLRLGALILTGALVIGYAATNRSGEVDSIASSGAAAAVVPAAAAPVPTVAATPAPAAAVAPVTDAPAAQGPPPTPTPAPPPATSRRRATQVTTRATRPVPPTRRTTPRSTTRPMTRSRTPSCRSTRPPRSPNPPSGSSPSARSPTLPTPATRGTASPTKPASRPAISSTRTSPGSTR